MIDQVSGRPIILPEDLFVHEEMQTEWWYYHGHLLAGDRPFSFHFVFFRRRTDRDRIGKLIPLKLFGPVFHVAHLGVTDFHSRQFHWAHRRSINGDAGAAADEYHVWLRDWTVRGRHGGPHVLTARSRDTSLQLEMIPTKLPVLHGRDGLVQKAHDQSNHYFSFPRMNASGCLTIGGRTHEVHGTVWMDREFGNWLTCSQYQGWDWMAIQFADGRELMFYVIRDNEHRPTAFSSLTLIDDDGSRRVFSASQFSLTECDRWVSPYSGAIYPSRWRLCVPDIATEVDIEPMLACQELDTRGSSQIIYWEGAANARGKVDDRPARGRAFVELVGYDRSHHSLTLLDWVVNELRFRLAGGQRTNRQQS